MQSFVVSLAFVSVASGFVVRHQSPSFSRDMRCRPVSSAPAPFRASPAIVMQEEENGRADFEFSFVVPKKGIVDQGTANVKLAPLLDNSEIVVVRYNLPFGLSAKPDPTSGQVVVTKDGNGGEKVGDILRQTSYWREAQFGGKEPGLFDVSKNADNFELVVKALQTNVPSVADEIVLVFERAL